MTYTHVNGIDLYYESTGTGRPLVFLHGWGTNGRVWDAQVSRFQADHQVLILDWRGCGHSNRVDVDNTLNGNVADLLALIDALELHAPVIVGSSVAASFAIAAALAAPQKIGAIVSVDGPGYWLAQGMQAQQQELVEQLAIDRVGTVEGWVPKWFGQDSDPDLIAQTIAQVLDSNPAIDQMQVEATTFDPRQEIARLAVPAAFIHGRLDPAIPLAVSQTLAELTPRGALHIIEGAGHLPHQQNPTAFNTILSTVLASMVTTSAI